MGAQGDQAAPKAPKLKPNDAQSLPKVDQRPPKTSKGAKTTPKCDQKCSKNVESRVKKINGIQNDFGEHILIANLQILVEFGSPNLQKPL